MVPPIGERDFMPREIIHMYKFFAVILYNLSMETVKTLRKKAAEFSGKIRRIDNLRKNSQDGIKARRYFWK
jgi:hypothetical protein